LRPAALASGSMEAQTRMLMSRPVWAVQLEPLGLVAC
jgi:hypothetical protein